MSQLTAPVKRNTQCGRGKLSVLPKPGCKSGKITIERGNGVVLHLPGFDIWRKEKRGQHVRVRCNLCLGGRKDELCSRDKRTYIERSSRIRHGD